MKPLTTSIFIERAKQVHKDKYIYDKSIYKLFQEKLIITCKTHGDFLQTPYTHLKGSGCRKCVLDKQKILYSFTTDQFIKKSEKIHNNYFDYSKSIYNGDDSIVIITCPNHGDFKQRAGAHMRGAGCMKCCYDRKRLDTKYFISEAKKTHGDRYDYSKSQYTDSTSKIEIICKIHGSFWQRQNHHINGSGCQKCGDLTKGKEKRSWNDVFNEIKNVHGDLYDYSKVEYIGFYDKIEIICNKHGSFLQTPNSHLNGRGCRLCGFESSSEAKKISHEEFLKRSNIVHNNKYDYSKVEYINCHEKVTIICPIHGEFKQTPIKHYNGEHGCSKCVSIISKPEAAWLNSLSIPDDEHHRQVKIKIGNKTIKVDGYDPETNTVYEFHGDFWHGNPKVWNKDDINQITGTAFGELYIKTIERENLIKTNGYKLVSIWESDYAQ